MSTSNEPKSNSRKLTEEELQKFENELLQKPDLEELRNKLIFLYLYRRNWDELQRHIILCAQYTPWSTFINMTKYIPFSHNPSHRDQLLKILENSLQKYPEEARIYNNLGHIYDGMAVPPIYETKDYVDWTGLKPTKENPKKVDKASFAKAEEYFKKALSLITKDFDKHFCLKALGSSYLCNLDYPKALEYYEQAFQYASPLTKSMITFDISLTYLFMKQWDKAKEHFHKTIEFDKEGHFAVAKQTMLAYEWLGYIALKEDDIDLAKQYLKKSSQVNNDSYIKNSGFPLILARKLLEKGVVKEIKEYCIEIMSITSAHKDKVLELLKECDSKLG